MVRLDFRENTKMLTVLTNNIFDQKYCIIITRTSLCTHTVKYVHTLSNYIHVYDNYTIIYMYLYLR